MAIPTKLQPFGNDNLEDKFLTFRAIEQGSTLKLVMTGSVNISNLYYSKNNANWNLYTINQSINLDVEDNVRFWNHSNSLSMSDNNLVYFVMTGKIEALGNIQSLLNFKTDAPNFCFRKLFQNCAALIKAPKILPASSVGEKAYGAMFSKTGITEAPKISATSLGERSCQYMFEECPIIEAPDIIATTFGNYACSYMFSSCNQLTKGPKILASSIEADYCLNYMFRNCKSLQSLEVNFGTWSTKQNLPTANWLNGAPRTGTFICPEELVIPSRDVSHVPSDWTIVTK